jgi:hypothetical protein
VIMTLFSLITVIAIIFLFIWCIITLHLCYLVITFVTHFISLFNRVFQSPKEVCFITFFNILCPLSLNGLQHKKLMIQHAIIFTNTLINKIYNTKYVSATRNRRRTFRTCEYLKSPKSTEL